MTPWRRPVAECWCCGREGTVQARGKGAGLCERCAQRWSAKGWQGPGPGPEFVPATVRAAELLAGLRLHDTWDAVPPPGVLTARQAAELRGVTPRTICRYRAALREAS